jgi:hypothetical protein
MKKYKWVQWAICFIIGHDVEWVIEHIKSVHDAERNLVTLKEFGADGTNRKR